MISYKKFFYSSTNGGAKKIPQTYKELMEELIQKMYVELMEYERESKKNYCRWHLVGNAVLFLSITTSAFAGLSLFFPETQWLKIMAFGIPLVGTFIAGIGNINKFREKELIWESGRISLIKLLGHAEKLYLDAGEDEKEFGKKYLQVLDTFTAFSRDQHQEEGALRQDDLIEKLDSKTSAVTS